MIVVSVDVWSVLSPTCLHLLLFSHVCSMVAGWSEFHRLVVPADDAVVSLCKALATVTVERKAPGKMVDRTGFGAAYSYCKTHEACKHVTRVQVVMEDGQRVYVFSEKGQHSGAERVVWGATVAERAVAKAVSGSKPSQAKSVLRSQGDSRSAPKKAVLVRARKNFLRGGVLGEDCNMNSSYKAFEIV